MSNNLIPNEVREGVRNVWGKVSNAFDRWMPWRNESDDHAVSVRHDGETFWPSFLIPDATLDTDMEEDEKEVRVTVEFPGLEKDDLRIEVLGKRLVIRGEKRTEREKRGKTSHLSEIHYGSVSRSLILPAEVDVEKAKAKYRNGVLRLTLPKQKTEIGTRVKVRVS